MIIPIIAGPTGVGKTSLSIKLAKEINGEIISADSMQIYKNMNIGTAKVTTMEADGVPHHLIDIKEPNEEYSVAEFSSDARTLIKDIIGRGKVPIIVGGTGLYINALQYGISFEKNIDLNFREELEQEVEKDPKKLEELYIELLKLDEASAIKIPQTDSRRIIRALEIYYKSGETKTNTESKNRTEKTNEFIVFVLNRDRDELYTRINKRVEIMLEEGLIEEVRGIKDKLSKTSSQAIGYKEIVEYLDNKISYEEMVDLIKQRSRNYAKRQLTWFKKNNPVYLDANNEEESLKTILDKIK